MLALDAAADGDPTGLCRGLINVVALLSAAGVSRALLYAAGQQGLLQHPGTGTAAGPDRIDEALGRLASASLLTFSADGATVAAHRLTMRVAVERQAQDGTLAGLGAGLAGLLAAVTESLPEPWQNRPAARDAIQQIMALHEHLAPYLGEQDAALTETLLRLRGWAIWCLNDLGDSFTQAIEYGQDLVADCERVLGETHPDTLTCRNNLAPPTRRPGGWTRPSRCSSATLADRERVLGETHPDTLGSRNNLAFAYQDAGRLDEAIPLLRAHPRRPRAGPGRDPPRHPDRPQQPRCRLPGRRAAGRGHPAVWSAPSPTASGSWARPTPTPWPPATTSLSPTRTPGGWTRPSRCSSATLADCERVLGETHPDTLTSRNNLAVAYRDAGRLDEAIPLFERTLADRERVLGETHPDTLSSRNNLAIAYQDAGRLDEAIPLSGAHPRRPRAGPGRDPPRHPDLPQQPRCRLPGRGAAG